MTNFDSEPPGPPWDWPWPWNVISAVVVGLALGGLVSIVMLALWGCRP